VQDQRIARYGLLRGYFHGADDDGVDEGELQRLQSVTVMAGAACLGQRLGDSLDTETLGVAVVSVRQAGGRVGAPEPGMTLQAGDTLVLSGRPQDLARAESLLLKG